ncbi:DUF4190 domain-containing protein [Cellulomonas iranensis]|uniref:DUF4190 domain-containing protein n=1 Tax=Cellulomonas iranensis TaxID=76862 RepID=UPI000B3C7865|nr:DUF4190 domain-containing protein [Cellulomonas iranensis]
MTSTPEDRDTPAAGAGPVQEPPAAEPTVSEPPAPEPPAAPGATASATLGTSASPVYGGQDTQPLAGTAPTQPLPPAGDTQPLTWAAPAPTAPLPAATGAPAPTSAPQDPWAVRADATSGASASPYGAAPTPPPLGSGGATPPPPGVGGAAPTYGTPPPPPGPGYGAAPPAGPGYGAPAGPGPWGPPATPVDGLAIASVITSGAGLLLMLGAPGPIGIGLGIGSLARIKRTGARGRGLAITGIVLGAVGTLVLGFMVWLFVTLVAWGQSTAQQASDALGSDSLEQLLEDLQSGSGSSGSGELDGLFDDLQEQLDQLDQGTGSDASGTLPQYTLPQDVAAGTCYSTFPGYYDLSDAIPLPCDVEHDAEVVALVTATGAPATDLSADDPVMTTALDECAAAIDAIDPGLLERGYADVWLPHPDQVAAGQLVGYCIVEDDAPRTGSLLGATP